MRYNQVLSGRNVRVFSDGRWVRLNSGDSLVRSLNIADAISLAVRFLSEIESRGENTPELFKGRRPNQPGTEEIEACQKVGAPNLFYRGGEISFGEEDQKILLRYDPESETLEFLDPERQSLVGFKALCKALLQDVITFKFDRRYFIPPVNQKSTPIREEQEDIPETESHGILLGYLMATETVLIEHSKGEPLSDLLDVLRRTLEVAIARISKTTTPVELRLTPTSIEELPQELLQELEQRVLATSLDEIRLKGRKIIEEEIQEERRKLAEEIGREKSEVDRLLEEACQTESKVAGQIQAMEEERHKLDSLKATLEAREKAAERAEELLRQGAFAQAMVVLETAQGRPLTAKEQQDLHLFQLKTRRQGRRDQDRIS
jgi:hypothetical protein